MTRTATPRRRRTAARASCRRTTDDVSHGGNVFGVISASYTDHGGTGGVPALTTVGAEPDPPEAARGRARPQPVRHEHGREQRRRPQRASEPGHASWQPLGRRLDPAQRAVQPAEHRLRHVPSGGRRHGPHRGLPARGDRGSSGRSRRTDRADLQPGLDRRHGRLDEPDVPDLAVGHARAVPRVPHGYRWLTPATTCST